MKVSGWFNSGDIAYTTSSGQRYYHDGVDFSGNTKNFIKDWKFGIDGTIICSRELSNYLVKSPYTDEDRLPDPKEK